ncbi:hypothetical protein T4A_10361 [Trichinella pseudospiralis]|uniref:Uncharacterized protein n=1 Tax=Trichinella pseudospiralis TaxID=6337 RepID=A0A0V1E8Z0_TRIPS|nr:hypothetical protein T4A_10361 [Trichinella pseudospiralis]
MTESQATFQPDVYAPERAISPPYCNAAKDWREPEDGRGRDSGVRKREKSLYVPAPHVALSASSQELRRQEENFNLLNRALVSPLVTGKLNLDRPCLLDMEGSDDAISAVLSQEYEQDTPAGNHVCQLVTNKSKDQLLRYAKEVLALDLEGQVARCLETVAEFDFEVAVWPKKKYQNVGALSCPACTQCASGDDS